MQDNPGITTTEVKMDAHVMGRDEVDLSSAELRLRIDRAKIIPQKYSQRVPGGSTIERLILERSPLEPGGPTGKFETFTYRCDLADVVVYSMGDDDLGWGEVLSSRWGRTLPAGSRILAVYFHRNKEIIDFTNSLDDLHIKSRSRIILANKIEMAFGARGIYI